MVTGNLQTNPTTTTTCRMCMLIWINILKNTTTKATGSSFPNHMLKNLYPFGLSHFLKHFTKIYGMPLITNVVQQEAANIMKKSLLVCTSALSAGSGSTWNVSRTGGPSKQLTRGHIFVLRKNIKVHRGSILECISTMQMAIYLEFKCNFHWFSRRDKDKKNQETCEAAPTVIWFTVKK